MSAWMPKYSSLMRRKDCPHERYLSMELWMECSLPSKFFSIKAISWLQSALMLRRKLTLSAEVRELNRVHIQWLQTDAHSFYCVTLETETRTHFDLADNATARFSRYSHRWINARSTWPARVYSVCEARSFRNRSPLFSCQVLGDNGTANLYKLFQVSR